MSKRDEAPGEPQGASAAGDGGAAVAVEAAPQLRHEQGLRPWLGPIVVFAAVLLGLVTVIALAGQAAAPDVPPEPGAAVPPEVPRPVTALDVQQVSGGRLTVGGDQNTPPRDLALAADAKVELLRPIAPGEVQTGDWVTLVGIPNEVKNFSIRSIVVLGGAGQPDEEGIVRSAAGFAGHETARDQRERPLIGGRVERIEGQVLTLNGPSGEMTLTLTPNAPLRRLVAATAGDIRAGARIAVPGDGTGTAAAALAE